MSLEKKLNLWKNNNLITTEQFDSILEYENKNSNSKLGIYTIITLGCVVLGLGIIALVASNWEVISDFVKLVIDFFILSILGLYIFRKYDNSNIRVKDSLIVVFILLIIGSIGLISQIYNTGGELYQAFLFWSIITLPIILFSESIFPSQFWIVSSFFVLNSYLEIFLRDKNPNLLITINILCIPNFFILLGLSLNYFNLNSLKKFSKSFYFWGFLIFLINTISVNFLSTDLELLTDNFKIIYSLYFIITILLFILTYKKDKKLSILYLAFIGLYFMNFYVHIATESTKLLNASLFIALWFLISFIFLNLKYLKLFEFSFIIIGFRFLLIYFEIFSSLLLTGVGLVFSGILIILIAVLYIKFKTHLLNLIKRLA
jgi:uncharacterized membrane protein